MKTSSAVKQFFLALGLLAAASSALKLSDIVQLRQKLRRMDSASFSLPAGRKLAEVVPAFEKGSLKATGRPTKASPRKLKSFRMPKMRRGSQAVKLLQHHSQKKPNRRLKTHLKPADAMQSMQNEVTGSPRPARKLKHVIKRKAMSNLKKTEAPLTVYGGRKTKAKGKVAAKGKALVNIKRSMKAKHSLKKHHVAANRRASKHHQSAVAKSLVKHSRATKGFKKHHHKQSVSKAHKKHGRQLRGNGMTASPAGTPNQKAPVSLKKQDQGHDQNHAPQRKAMNNSAQNFPASKRSMAPEAMALDAMKTAEKAAVPVKSTPAVTERKLLDLPSQNEFYEQLINNYYPTI